MRERKYPVTVTYMPGSEDARKRRNRMRRKSRERPEATLVQDATALARTLGIANFADPVHAEADPDTWFIYDLFARYGDLIRRETRRAAESYDPDDWVMDFITRIWDNPPYGLVPYAQDGRAYSSGPAGTKPPTQTSRYFVSLARSWVKRQDHLSLKTRQGYRDIISQYLDRQTGKCTVRQLLRDEELVQSLFDGAPESVRLAIGEIIVGAAEELARLEGPWAQQPGNISMWLATVLRNMLRNLIRDQKRHREILEAKASMLGWDSMNDGRPNGKRFEGALTHVEPRNESAEATFMRRESEREILGRIMRLPRDLAPVAYMRYWGFTTAEIAWLLDIKQKAVEYRLRKIRSPRIRAALEI